MSYLGIILFAFSALIAIGNLCSAIETWMQRRRGIKIKYSSVPMASLLCGLLAWIKARGLLGAWAFLPALLDPGTWLSLIMLWRYWADRRRPGNPVKKRPPPKKL